MIWLDGLDLPLYQAFPTNFAEMYSDSRYPSTYVPGSSKPVATRPTAPLTPHPRIRTAENDGNLRIGWDTAQAAWDAQPRGHAVFHYVMGDATQPPRPQSRTLGGQAERVGGGCESAAIQQSCSFACHCVRGRGATRLVLAGGTAQ